MGDTIFDIKVKEIIANQLGISLEEIFDDCDIADDLGATSLDVVELVSTIEETFGIKISDSDILENKTVGEVCDFVCEKGEIQ